jgi:leucyl/phenylalanyl-tRNA--protein transferase
MIPTQLLVSAYASGWFPMAVADGDIRWYSPDPRGILPLNAFHLPKRLARVIRGGLFRVEVNRDFPAVIRACASVDRDEDDDGGTWIDEEIVKSYCALHDAGIAHSVEAWQGERLVGGLYGVALRGAFFGESMFHHVTDASKVVLAALVDRLRDRRFALLDVQWVTPHLEQFGAIEIPRDRYLELLADALRRECRFA